ncbi:related to MAM3-Protein required for normal mitochondrial morphology [Serendipita indica DSM 11827]|uniref:Related to MAM3-Protein required for normal mitochondrial morphology n=1 Tax=Serendipita indica (strain DSM 11827) TaxID=1109443 RepID=G4TB90_SERID|nr:related to MAM3-Protein required for normal mitochondrial morphology [Serendipita indica DSM 11827]
MRKLSLFYLLKPALMVYASPFLFYAATAPEPGEDPDVEVGSPDFWFHIIVSAGLVILGGVFAGLTLGLMGLDELHLRVLATASDDTKEKKNAQKGEFLSFPYNFHLNESTSLKVDAKRSALGVLLLGNVVINESLPIFLDSAIGGGIAAILISTTMIVIFGIIPQAVCAKHGLSIGAHCAPFVLLLMYLFAPIAWPIAKLLDWVLGAHDEHTYKKAELKSFLQFHRSGEEPLRDDEISILNGVLSLNEKTAAEIMTPWKDVVTVSADTVVDRKVFDTLLSSGYSRFPVTAAGKPTTVIGLLLIKKLLRYDPATNKSVGELPLSILPEAKPSINCFQALDYFQTGRSHLLLLTNNPGKAIDQYPMGVITLEDVIEEIIGEEIVDETDRYESNMSKRVADRHSNAAIMKGIFERAWRRGSMGTVKTTETRKDAFSGHINLSTSPAAMETQPLIPNQSKGGANQGNYGAA